ncbi:MULTISPECIES: hypothetical protein [unclassified Lentimonas]|uniref:hypothetical protein n=1 Tax=unclassified Lentimonas TaxID=2630993 RepID=UPI001327642C|nr:MULTISPECIES: hypothetical protein [unclassified Lentimonas]CAA6692053.1 Unannotated [Lentimonas sp. CC10]CAA6694002.1 Unannotated [Lentimonas sp. CC19]CAA7070262.1 Unannotated [Lentimonas sp. CC11]
MRWFLRSLLTLAFLGLAALAVLPHTATIRKEWNHLRETWAIVRSGEAIQPAAGPSKALAVKPDRGRTIVKPDDAPAQAIDTENFNADPFLSEARRRAQDDPEAAMAWLQTQSLSQDTLRGMLEIVAVWAADDSEGALMWLESNAQGLARLETLNSGIQLWSQQDPASAAAWIDGMANDGSKITAAKALATNWAKQSPDDASKWVEQLPPGNLRNEAAAALVESWITTAPEAAAIWALTEAEYHGNKELLDLSIEQYAQVNPDEAEQFLRSVNEAYEAPVAIETYVRTLAQNDPSQAMEWQTALTATDPLNTLSNSEVIMQEWSRTDSVSASIWLNEAATGPQRDAAIVGFTTTMLDFDPEAAIAWSNTISEPNQRVQQLNRVILSWSHTQPHEALKWVKEAELEPDLRNALASQIGAD